MRPCGGQRGAVDRVDGDVDEGRRAVADALAVEEHRRVVLLALADHDDAVHRHRRQHGAHRRDRGAVGAVLVAPPDPARCRQRRRLGDPDQLHGQVAVGSARGRSAWSDDESYVSRAAAADGCGPSGAAAVASRLVLDWNPNDPDTVKVHYDVSAWSIDQRAELTRGARRGRHRPCVGRRRAGRSRGARGRRRRPVRPARGGCSARSPIPLDDDDAVVEFGLDEWPAADRGTLTPALVEGRDPASLGWRRRVFVATDAEPVVDELLDSIEQGRSSSPGPPEAARRSSALSTLFSAADRLAKDADDQVGRDDLAELVAQLDLGHPPYGVPAGTWSKVIDSGARLIDLCDAEDRRRRDIIGAAQDLRSLVRQYVS